MTAIRIYLCKILDEMRVGKIGQKWRKVYFCGLDQENHCYMY